MQLAKGLCTWDNSRLKGIVSFCVFESAQSTHKRESGSVEVKQMEINAETTVAHCFLVLGLQLVNLARCCSFVGVTGIWHALLLVD